MARRVEVIAWICGILIRSACGQLDRFSAGYRRAFKTP